MQRTVAALAGVLALAVVTVACSSTAPSQSGTLQMMITDAPFDDATALHVTFKEVQVHRADGEDGWITVPFADPVSQTRTCNLKKLEGPFDILGVTSLEAGHFTQVRLVVDSATIYFGGTPTGQDACGATLAPPDGAGVVSKPLEIPSGEVKLNHPFELTTGGTTTIELDFDGNQSVRETGNGNYRMTPVIRILDVRTTGGQS